MRYWLYGAAALAVVIMIWWAGYYPVLTVNGKFIMRHSYDREVSGASQAYAALKATYPKLPAEDVPLEIMNRAVDNALIHDELYKEVDAKTLNGLLADKLNSIQKDQDFENALQRLYGYNLSEAQRYIFTPQAEQDILRGELTLKSRSFSDWLNSARTSAKVRIFSRSFTWQDGQVKRK